MSTFILNTNLPIVFGNDGFHRSIFNLNILQGLETGFSIGHESSLIEFLQRTLIDVSNKNSFEKKSSSAIQIRHLLKNNKNKYLPLFDLSDFSDEFILKI
ncbi:hypothetical protein BpHYR1_052777 [Brachionus plicatilis]|uniref:Uncharacterized protein n=1 Tax=Brachionus plicatilis TaxID=10195 RepID=A0A3M7T129_BRAPC|nr:hypothetical protein BpHYR1_052777 [Brachionus plicatilis]